MKLIFRTISEVLRERLWGGTHVQVHFCNILNEFLNQRRIARWWATWEKKQSRLNHNGLEMGISSGQSHNTRYCALRLSQSQIQEAHSIRLNKASIMCKISSLNRQPSYHSSAWMHLMGVISSSYFYAFIVSFLL